MTTTSNRATSTTNNSSSSSTPAFTPTTDTSAAVTVAATDSLPANTVKRNVAINEHSTSPPTQNQRNGKRCTAVTSVSTGSPISHGENCTLPNATSGGKHQPKKKKNGHHTSTPHRSSSLLRRTFSMTDEEFEEYVEDEEHHHLEAADGKSTCGSNDDEDKDSVVETTTSEDEEYEEVHQRRRTVFADVQHHFIDCELDESGAKYHRCALDDVDNTSDLTSSPPPPMSSPSSYSSPANSPSSSSLNPLQSLVPSSKSTTALPKESLDTLIHNFDKSLKSSSIGQVSIRRSRHHQHPTSPPPPPKLPESSSHHQELADSSLPSFADQCHTQVSSPSSKQKTPTSCCPLCCPDPEVRITSITNSNASISSPPTSTSDSLFCSAPTSGATCTKSHLLPYYPPTVSSIRDAVSHLTRLDDFNVVKLSHGFFSQVFKVIHFASKKVMVLKMNKEAGNRGNALKEIELLNKLNHENIVAYMGTVVHEGALHPLLEFINGGTLEQLIRPFYAPEDISSDSLSPLRGTYQPPSPIFRSCSVISPKVHRLRDPDWTFMKLMRDVSRGMDYLHSMGYLHRDLASKNIFIRKVTPSLNCDISHLSPTMLYLDSDIYDWYDDERLVAVIGDFGFATTEPTEEQKLSTVGSPYWLAPECFKNLWYNHKCDIYSFGVICCELNWRIPADPDFLPRYDDHFAVDFGKLLNKKDTALGKVAKLACNIKPTARPEFSTILDMFDFEMNKQLNSKNNGNQSVDSVTKMNGPNERSPLCSTSAASPFTFKRGYSLDSSMLQSIHLQSTFPKTCNENDVFEQHLLRRRYSSALAAAAKANGASGNKANCGHLNASSSSAAVSSVNCRQPCHHVHYHTNHLHSQPEQHHLLHRNYSHPLPDIRGNGQL